MRPRLAFLRDQEGGPDLSRCSDFRRPLIPKRRSTFGLYHGSDYEVGPQFKQVHRLGVI